VLTRGRCVPAHFTANANRVPAGIANRYVAVGALDANWPLGQLQPIASRRGKPEGTRAKQGWGIVREKKCDPACTRMGAAELVVACVRAATITVTTISPKRRILEPPIQS
jgi:hypothetical protein